MIDTKTNSDKAHLFKKITKDQAIDTGMAIILILLILGQFYHNKADIFHVSAIIVLIINMVIPNIYKPAAWLWFGFAHILGTWMSKLLLAILFIFLVTPVGIARNLLGKDTLFLKKWKKDDLSVFHVRNHSFQAEDVEKPY